MEWINQLVGRKSYGCDVIFVVAGIEEREGGEYAILYGRDIRLVADAPIEDLELMDENRLEEEDQQMRKMKENRDKAAEKERKSDALSFHLPGRVLHLDGDERYLKKCLKIYKDANVPHIGVHCPEKEMADRIEALIIRYQPQILVLTGHDAYLPAQGKKIELQAYRHSSSFVNAVKNARKIVPHLDQLVIFAGACQSHFESLIYAGANMASSPLRVNIHALDPAYAASVISYTSIHSMFTVENILPHTLADDSGIGGFETRGVLRVGMPYKKEMYIEAQNDSK
ncbi:sporulation peptidase YabG [Jeotgalibacillus salarius]|uniref:Sporulation peptidase YabG n=1 Tax=Jeotgalibacillus salarius TaxID=546023 RepID=A0A4Y8LCT0_9BACL|nr:sporulation peptidase YabG [Jeotgalibacillus salarius]TFD98336.1 sporulation peptidase YabG [Jeotgalibacillus salarius]